MIHLLDLPNELLVEIALKLYPKEDDNIESYLELFLNAQVDILNFGLTCKNMYEIITIYCFDEIGFPMDVNIAAVERYKSKSVWAPSDIKLRNKDLESISFVTKLILPHNRRISDNGLKHLPNLKVLSIRGSKITTRGLQYISKIEHLYLIDNTKLTRQNIIENCTNFIRGKIGFCNIQGLIKW